MQTVALNQALVGAAPFDQDAPEFGATGGPSEAGGIVTVKGALSAYRRTMRPIFRGRTLEQRCYVVESFIRHTDNMAVKAVKSTHIEDWMAGMEVSAATVRSRLSHLRSFFGWCAERQIIRSNPAAGIKAPRQPRATPRALSSDDLRKLAAVLPDDRGRLIISLMVDMGLRAGEVAGLEMADVDLFSNTMRVVGKGGHERMLPVPEVVRHCMDPYLAERGRGSGPLIRSQTNPHKGISAGAVSDLVSDWMNEAGIKSGRYDGVSAHALRHTCAENLWRHRVDLRTIAAAMGHNSPTTTWIYLRHTANIEELRQVMGQQIIDEPVSALQPVAEYHPPSAASGGAA